ncbi:MAG: hypothetical protein SGBAC_007108, partial [Bacillariaceae sp.]
MISFSEVLLPTYLGAAFAVLSYQMDQDNQFMVQWVKDAKSNPKGAAIQIATVAGLGLVTIPPVAALHTMATIGKLGATTSATATSTTSANASTKGLFASFQTKAAPVAVTKTTTATTKVLAATKTTTAVAATAGGVAAMSSVAVPISLGLATAFVSYQVDKDPDYAVKKLQAFLELWRTKVLERDVVPGSTSTSTSTSTSGGTLAVGSTASAAVMNEAPAADAAHDTKLGALRGLWRTKVVERE